LVIIMKDEHVADFSEEESQVKRIFTLGLYLPPVYEDRDPECIEVLGQFDHYNEAAEAMERYTVTGDQYFCIKEEHVLDNGETKLVGSWNHDGVRFRL